MHRPVTVMWRNGAAWHVNRFQGMAAQEQQQHAAAVNVVRAQPLIAVDAVEPEHLFVEGASAREVIDIEDGFEHAEESRHGCSTLVCRSFPRKRESGSCALILRWVPAFARTSGNFTPKPGRF